MAEESDLKTAELQAQAQGIDSLAVANFFIGLEPGVSHLKLQKLTYCAYGWYFIDFPDTNHPLVNEPVRAWKFGPVFHNLYRSLRDKEFVQESPFYYRPVPSSKSVEMGEPSVPLLNADNPIILPFLTEMSERYRKYTGSDLVGLTHRPNSPWRRVADELQNDFSGNHIIPDDYIRQEFEYLAT